MKRLACLALVVLALAGCDTVANGTPSSGGQPARNGSMADTERDANDLTNWCLNNGLCLPAEAPSYSTATTYGGSDGHGGGGW